MSSPADNDDLILFQKCLTWQLQVLASLIKAIDAYNAVQLAKAGWTEVGDNWTVLVMQVRELTGADLSVTAPDGDHKRAEVAIKYTKFAFKRFRGGWFYWDCLDCSIGAIYTVHAIRFDDYGLVEATPLNELLLQSEPA